jgi:hypothetical protein
MKRVVPGAILIIALIVAAVSITWPRIGRVTETWQTERGSIKVRVENRAENWAVVPGAYYVFQSMPPGATEWREIMTFREDDPRSIPRESIRFLNERVGYVFMGWMYAVTTDGGSTWSVWDAEKSLTHWECCPYGLIEDVRLAPDGTGTMVLSPDAHRRFKVPALHTTNFGRNWVP